ncbi:MAG: hypothetical protein ACM3WV_00990 [Bacillota bacterium]
MTRTIRVYMFVCGITVICLLPLAAGRLFAHCLRYFPGIAAGMILILANFLSILTFLRGERNVAGWDGLPRRLGGHILRRLFLQAAVLFLFPIILPAQGAAFLLSYGAGYLLFWIYLAAAFSKERGAAGGG